MLPAMDDTLSIKLRPFSIRHRRLLNDQTLEDLPSPVRHRLWTTLNAVDESFDVYHADNPRYRDSWSHLRRTQTLFDRLRGIPEDDIDDTLQYRVLGGTTADCFDVLECFCAWLSAASNRMPIAQQAINETLNDFHLPWRMSEGLVFKVDHDYLEDEILSEVAPLLGLAEFHGAHDEFIKARDYLTDDNARDAIGYANASFESALKTALGGCPKTGKELVQEYANKGLLVGLPLNKGQEVQKALTGLTTLRNALAGHGQGEKVLDVPRDYGVLAVGLAAVLNAFVTRQHLAREGVSITKPTPAPKLAKLPEVPAWDPDDDIPF